MREVSTRDLKDRLSEWVRVVEGGEQLVITRSGRAVAALVPLADVRASDSSQILADLAARGLVRAAAAVRPKGAFEGPPAPARGVDAADMVIEDRR